MVEDPLSAPLVAVEDTVEEPLSVSHVAVEYFAISVELAVVRLVDELPESLELVLVPALSTSRLP